MPPKETHEIKMMYAVYENGTKKPIVIEEIKDLTLEEAEPILEKHNFVKVTRCKDCKWRENEVCTNAYISRRIDDYGCYPNFYAAEEFYCAFGERREDEQIH